MKDCMLKTWLLYIKVEVFVVYLGGGRFMGVPRRRLRRLRK